MVGLAHSNVVDSQYQHDSRILPITVPNNSFSQPLYISPVNHIYSETFHSKFSYTEAWFTDQNTMPQEIEDRINLSLAINGGSI